MFPPGEQLPKVRGTRRGFDLEWKYTAGAFSEEEIYENRGRFARIFGGEAPSLRGKLFLDAGCGMGRYSAVAEEHGASVVSLDLTEWGVRQTSRRCRATVVQGDLLQLPFADGIFDTVFSMGVLHHTADLRRAFSLLVRSLKPGGWIVLGVYRTFPGVETVRALRRFTTILPPGLLFLLCFLAVPLTRVPRLGGYCYPWFTPEDHWKKRVIETYDHYHPPYQEYTAPEEVERWFHEEECEVRRVPFGSFLGRKSG